MMTPRKKRFVTHVLAFDVNPPIALPIVLGEDFTAGFKASGIKELMPCWIVPKTDLSTGSAGNDAGPVPGNPDVPIEGSAAASV